MRALVLFLAVLIAGCSAHLRVNSNTAPPAGTSVTGGSAGLQIRSSSLGAVIIAGMFVAAAAEDAREPRPFPSFATFKDWFFPPRAPELAPDRPINEQDCTRPVELSGNLKCR
jgi:hypothetical protein